MKATEEAIHKRGKRISNDDIHGKCLVLRLAERYGINVPLRTAGWIAKNVKQFMLNDEGIKLWSAKKATKGTRDVLFAILQAVDSRAYVVDGQPERHPADGQQEAAGTDSSHVYAQECKDMPGEEEPGKADVTSVTGAVTDAANTYRLSHDGGTIEIHNSETFSGGCGPPLFPKTHYRTIN